MKHWAKIGLTEEAKLRNWKSLSQKNFRLPWTQYQQPI